MGIPRDPWYRDPIKPRGLTEKEKQDAFESGKKIAEEASKSFAEALKGMRIGEPPHISKLKIGDVMEGAGLKFKVVYINNETVVLEPAGPIIIGEEKDDQPGI